MSTQVMPVPPTESDPLARVASRAVGGPMGRFAATPAPGRAVWITAALSSLVACLTLAVGVLQKSYCLRFGWGAPGSYWKACYSDLPEFAARTGLAGGEPYGTQPLTEPLGVGVVAHLLSSLVPGSGLERQNGMFVAWAVTAAVLLVLTATAVALTARTRPQVALHVAASPLLVTVALVSMDLVGVAFVAAGLWAWARRRPTAAGVLLGLAVASRTSTVLVVLAIAVVALRAGAWRDGLRVAGIALITVVLALMLGMFVYGDGVLLPYRTWAASTAHLNSTWYLATLAGHPIQVGVVTLLAVLGWLLAAAGGVMLALGVAVRPRVAEVALVMTCVVLVTGKMLPVQASLVLLPLIALAGVPWRDHLVWATAEVVSFIAVWLYLAGIDNPTAALPAPWYAALVALRLLGIAWLGASTVVRAVRRRPWPGEIDDAAGPAAGKADAVVVRYAR